MSSEFPSAFFDLRACHSGEEKLDLVFVTRCEWSSLVAQPVKNPPAMLEAWKIPWRREGLLTAVFWPREFHGLEDQLAKRSWTRLSYFHFTCNSQRSKACVLQLTPRSQQGMGLGSQERKEIFWGASVIRLSLWDIPLNPVS